MMQHSFVFRNTGLMLVIVVVSTLLLCAPVHSQAVSPTPVPSPTTNADFPGSNPFGSQIYARSASVKFWDAFATNTSSSTKFVSNITFDGENDKFMAQRATLSSSSDTSLSAPESFKGRVVIVEERGNDFHMHFPSTKGYKDKTLKLEAAIRVSSSTKPTGFRVLPYIPGFEGAVIRALNKDGNLETTSTCPAKIQIFYYFDATVTTGGPGLEASAPQKTFAKWMAHYFETRNTPKVLISKINNNEITYNWIVTLKNKDGVTSPVVADYSKSLIREYAVEKCDEIKGDDRKMSSHVVPEALKNSNGRYGAAALIDSFVVFDEIDPASKEDGAIFPFDFMWPAIILGILLVLALAGAAVGFFIMKRKNDAAFKSAQLGVDNSQVGKLLPRGSSRYEDENGSLMQQRWSKF